MSSAECGVYGIENLQDRWVYIGSSIRGLHQRWLQHQLLLRQGRHPVQTLQDDWIQHGPGWFKFVVLQVLDSPVAVVGAERYWLEQVMARGFVCYNTRFPREYGPRVRQRTMRVLPTPIPQVLLNDGTSYALDDAARILKIRPGMFRKIVQRGEFEAVQRDGQWRVPREVIDRLKTIPDDWRRAEEPDETT